MPKKEPNYFHEIGSRVICSGLDCEVADRKVKKGIKLYKLYLLGTKTVVRNVRIKSNWHKEYNLMKYFKTFE